MRGDSDAFDTDFKRELINQLTRIADALEKFVDEKYAPTQKESI